MTFDLSARKSWCPPKETTPKGLQRKFSVIQLNWIFCKKVCQISRWFLQNAQESTQVENSWVSSMWAQKRRQTAVETNHHFRWTDQTSKRKSRFDIHKMSFRAFWCTPFCGTTKDIREVHCKVSMCTWTLHANIGDALTIVRALCLLTMQKPWKNLLQNRL